MALGPQAQSLATDQLAKWLLEDFPIKIQIAAVWPYRPIEGKSLGFASTQQLQPAVALDDFQSIPDNTSVPASPPKAFQLVELAVGYRISYSAQDRFASPTDVDASESALAIRKLIYRYFQLLDSGSAATAGEFDSLNLIADPSMILDLEGAAPTLEHYDQAYLSIRDNDGRPTAIMGSTEALRTFLNANYDRGFRPELVMDTWSDPVRGTVQASRIALHGTPWYINDLIQTRQLRIGRGRAATQTPVTNVYFMVLGDHGEPGPGHGVAGIVPAPVAETMFQRRQTQEPGGSTIFVDWTWPVGLAVGSRGALSVLRDGQVAVR